MVSMKLGEILSKVIKSKSILVIDDEDKIRDLISHYLKRSDFDQDKIVHAADGAEAIRKIHNQEFGLIIVDIILPKKNGLEVYKEIRSKARTKNIPVLIISGNLSSSIVKKAIYMGAKHILTKPFKYDVFVERLSRCAGMEVGEA